MIVYLDTNVVIYTVEQNPVFGPKVRTRLAAARAAGDTLMLSDLTRMECLVGPLKSGDAALEADFHTFFGVTNVVAITATGATGLRTSEPRTISNQWTLSTLPHQSNTVRVSSCPAMPALVLSLA
jgi:hypothetical protein